MEESDRLSALRTELVHRLGAERYNLWVGTHVSFEFSGEALRLGVATRFEVEGLRRRLHRRLTECCHAVWGGEVRIEYVVREFDTANADQTGRGCAPPAEKVAVCGDKDVPRDSLPGLSSDSEAEASHVRAAIRGGERPRAQSPWQKSAAPHRPSAKSTFENLVLGKGNQLAVRTAKAVAERLGHYGPLLIYGPPGVGKTHLMYAMMQYLRRSGSRCRAVRVTAEQFTAEFLQALNQRGLPGFRQKFRTVDVLLVDDIQFLVGKAATLDELLHTVDALHEQGKQVVLTCDRSPGELHSGSKELVSRLAGGLAIPVELPDYPTRVELVRQFFGRMEPLLGTRVDDETIRVVATQVAGSARQLRGAINRLVVTSEALGRPVTAEMARTTLAEYVQQNTPSVRLADIQRAVCQVFGVEVASLKSPRKTRSVTEPRMLAMWLSCKLTQSALGEISEYYGRRSHSTVISAQRKVERMVSQGKQVSVGNRPCTVEEAIRKVESILRTA